ncbi:hypothetical protein EI555_018054 [Monodon monoceros]|uniref:S-phase kinase-associated protein 1 n=1 Tax=Monodon monoceros TaxID=40151 RepID=A0A4U1FQR2_MONMO|nr:hypothetical protein EI555_018054 [Monodon monoceros]
MPSIKLQSCDREIFEVDVEIAKQSVTIKTTLEDLGMDDEGDDDPVPLPNVNAAILKKVIQWCTHHKDDPPPPEDDENKEKQTDDIPVWDQEFPKVDQGTLFELILAANYLDVKAEDIFPPNGKKIRFTTFNFEIHFKNPLKAMYKTGHRKAFYLNQQDILTPLQPHMLLLSPDHTGSVHCVKAKSKYGLDNHETSHPYLPCDCCSCQVCFSKNMKMIGYKLTSLQPYREQPANQQVEMEPNSLKSIYGAKYHGSPLATWIHAGQAPPPPRTPPAVLAPAGTGLHKYVCSGPAPGTDTENMQDLKLVVDLE